MNETPSELEAGVGDDGLPIGLSVDDARVVAELDEPRPWAHPRWEGHTHEWPELEQLDELPAEHVVSCSECGLPLLAGVLRDELRGARDG